jgi:predicted membrane channel-forming protein YqfA (hemolysin III family)
MKLKKQQLNKKAQMPSFTIFSFIIFSFLVVVFFGGLIYIMGMIADVMHQAGVSNEVNAGNAGYVNMTQASDQIFGSQAESIKALRMVSIVYILGLAVVIIVTNVFIKKHPILYFAYILIAILAVIFSPPISNAYENLLNSGIYDGGLQYFTASNFILLNLPTIVLIISIIGALLGLVNLVRTGGESTDL